MNRESIANALAAVAAILGIAAIVTRPFLLAPIGLIVLLVSAKLTANQRYTAPAAGVLAIGALAGAAIAVGYTNPLY